MVRPIKTSAAANGSTAAEHTTDVPGLHRFSGVMSLSVRDWLNGSLVAAQDVANWLERSQRLNAEAANTWHEHLSAAMREAEQADNVQKLVGVTNHLANRQMGTAVEQFGAGVKQLLEAEAQWVEHVRDTTVGLSQRMMQTAASAPANEGGNTSPLAQLGHAQAEWLAMTQRWIDSVRSVQNRPQ